MPAIGRFLELITSQRATALRLGDGQLARLEVEGHERPITRQPFTPAQVRALVLEIAPAEAARTLEAGGGARFRYASDSSGFDVSVTPTGGAWHVEARPVEALSAAAPAPAAPAAAAPASEVNAWHARIDALLTELVAAGASDLHLRAGHRPMVRLHGSIVRFGAHAELDGAAVEGMLAAIQPERNRAEYAERHDTDFAYELPGVARFRCNALRDRHGPGAVFRVIPSRVQTADELGLSSEIQALCDLSRGLVLVTGPTGSGKSTTLAALVDRVNRTRSDHIITIEDPIEFVHAPGTCLLTQRQVGQHTDSFKSALRAALREDPDIILVGELRDLETMSIAIETAETGHLVFGTLHTTSAVSTVDRLIDQFPADRQAQVRVMLSESLKGVISQVLCRKVGGGRVAALEVLLSVPAVANLIREGKTFQLPSIMQTSRRLGMVTLNDALMAHVDAGVVEPREAWLKAADKSGMAALLGQRGHDTSQLAADAPQNAPGGRPAQRAPAVR